MSSIFRTINDKSNAKIARAHGQGESQQKLRIPNNTKINTITTTKKREPKQKTAIIKLLVIWFLEYHIHISVNKPNSNWMSVARGVSVISISAMLEQKQKTRKKRNFQIQHRYTCEIPIANPS